MERAQWASPCLEFTTLPPQVLDIFARPAEDPRCSRDHWIILPGREKRCKHIALLHSARTSRHLHPLRLGGKSAGSTCSVDMRTLPRFLSPDNGPKYISLERSQSHDLYRAAGQTAQRCGVSLRAGCHNQDTARPQASRTRGQDVSFEDPAPNTQVPPNMEGAVVTLKLVFAHETLEVGGRR